jgi:hypothetical protein
MTLNLYIEPATSDISYVTKYIPETVSMVQTEEAADYILSAKFPWSQTDHSLIQKALDSYRSTDKKVLVFLVTDTTDIFDIPNNVLFFRTSLYKTQQQENEYLLPFVWTNFSLETTVTDKADKTDKTDNPIIGFCGLASEPRKKTLQRFATDPRIETNFIIRDQFWGGSPHNPQLITDYEQNIRNTEYTLCNRGAGNFSMRLYDVLSAARIPVFIDTDMKMPFADKINWSAITVTSRNEEELIENLLQAHKTRDIAKTQNECRRIFKQYFTAENYFRHIFNQLSNQETCLD